MISILVAVKASTNRRTTLADIAAMAVTTLDEETVAKKETNGRMTKTFCVDLATTAWYNT